MLFSVIVPVYNVENYIGECLDSIVNQEFSDYEIILVDDGSTDSSGKICDEYKENYPERTIYVVHQANMGSSGARNSGLKIAKGEWIWFVDSDDYVEKTSLKLLSDYIDKYSPEMISFNYCLISEDNSEHCNRIYIAENDTLNLSSDEKKLNFLTNDFMRYQSGWEASNRILKKDIIEKNGILFFSTDLVFAEDYLFVFQYIQHIYTYLKTCNILYYYRQRKESLIHNIDYSTVFIRLCNWNQYAYKTVSKNKLLKTFYYRIMFHLFNFHIQHLPEETGNNTIEEYVDSILNYQGKSFKMERKMICKNKREFSSFLFRIDWVEFIQDRMKKQ